MRIIIAESQAVTLRALTLLLESVPGQEVIGEAGDQKDLLTQVKTQRPDLVILDMALPGKALGELVARLRELDRRMGVIVIAGQPKVERLALEIGADAFVLIGSPPKELLLAIEAVRKRTQTLEGDE